MRDPYQIDLSKYSLAKFKHSLKTRHLIPSRVMLKEDLDARFGLLEGRGITHLQALVDALKTKQKLAGFSQETGLSVAYLTLLNREAKSYLAKPVALDKFPGVSGEHLARLDALGIRSTKHLFSAARDRDQRARLAQEAGIPAQAMDELVSLSDLARIYGVGPVFARMMVDVGIRSVKAFVEHTAEDFIRIYEEQTQKKADFSAGEIRFSLELARELEIAVDL